MIIAGYVFVKRRRKRKEGKEEADFFRSRGI
jgi:hypothetical protein